MVGLLVAVTVIYILEYLSHAANPVSEKLDFKDKEAVARFIASLPAKAFMYILLAHAAGSFAGGFAATAIDRNKGKRNTWIISILLLAAGVYNLVAIPHHPVWFAIADVLIYVPLALLGSLTAKNIFTKKLS